MTINTLINAVISHKKRVLVPTISGTIFVFLVLYFIYPYKYNSTVVILPPEQKSSSGLSALMQGSDLSSIMTSQGSANSQLWAEILKSRTSKEYVIKSLDLTPLLGDGDISKALNALNEMISIEVTKEGLIKLNSEITTPPFAFFSSENAFYRKLSADISNSFYKALDSINRDKLTNKSKRTRIYIGEQIESTKTKLDSIEKSLVNFQKINKAVALSDQLKASIEAASKIKAEIITNEISLGYLSQDLNTNNNVIVSLKKRINELKEQYEKLSSSNDNFLVSFNDAPELFTKLGNLYRESKVLNEVYLLLQQQFYKEKIQENKDIPIVEVLDSAIPPDRPSSPRVIFSSFLAGIFFFLVMCLIVSFEYIKMEKFIRK